MMIRGLGGLAAMVAVLGGFTATALANGGLSVTMTVASHLLKQGDRTDVAACATNDSGTTQHRIQVLIRTFDSSGHKD